MTTYRTTYEPPHPRGIHTQSECGCRSCGTPLWREPCGCWTDCHGTRWDLDGKHLHQPADGFGRQPDTCKGAQ